MSNKYEELEILYTNLGKVIFEGLSNYAKYDYCIWIRIGGRQKIIVCHCWLEEKEALSNKKMTSKEDEMGVVASYNNIASYNFRSTTQVATSTLQGPLMFLKAAYTSCPSYIDRCVIANL